MRDVSRSPAIIILTLPWIALMSACSVDPFISVASVQEKGETQNLTATTPSSTPEIQTPPSPTEAVEAPLPTPVPTPSKSSEGCYDASFISDVTIPDGAIMDPEQVFLKIWRIKNTGDCPWPEDLVFELLSGDQLGTTLTVHALPYPEGAPIEASLGERSWADLLLPIVQAGETVDLPMMFQAPRTAGDFVSIWSLRSRSSGQELTQVYVQIRVGETENLEPSQWGGEWTHKNQHIGSTVSPLFLQQQALQVRGYFYTVGGELYLLEGGYSEGGTRVVGTFGPPYHDGFPFEWRLSEDATGFRGVYQDQLISGGAWCGTRDPLRLPTPCALQP